MTDVRAMCAIGRSGQLGLNGHLPWEGDTRPEFLADVEAFWAATRGHVLVAGARTIRWVPDFAYAERTIVEIHSGDVPEEVISRFPGRVVYIGGGPAVWSAYAHLIRHWDINRLPYDGDADTWFDPKWLTQAKPAAR